MSQALGHYHEELVGGHVYRVAGSCASSGGRAGQGPCALVAGQALHLVDRLVEELGEDHDHHLVVGQVLDLLLLLVEEQGEVHVQQFVVGQTLGLEHLLAEELILWC